MAKRQRRIPVGHSTETEASVSYWGGRRNQGQIRMAVGSEEWFIWLEKEESFRMSYHPKGDLEPVNFVVRPEKRRGKHTYWQGWKTINKKTLKKYIGSTAMVNKERLDAAGEWFHEQLLAVSALKATREQRLRQMVEELFQLVEELAAGSNQPQLSERAWEELERMRMELKVLNEEP